MRALKTKIAQRRAPDDAEYAELTYEHSVARRLFVLTLSELRSWFSSFSKDVKDLEARVVAFNRAANSLIVEAERVALQSATLCGPVGVGRNGEYAGVKTQQSDHKQRFADVTEAFRALNTELRSVQQRIDERHLLGANMEKLKKKIEKLSEDDAKNVAQFEEANTAEDQYFAAHNDSLAELQLWRVKLAKMHLTPLHHQIKVGG